MWFGWKLFTHWVFTISMLSQSRCLAAAYERPLCLSCLTLIMLVLGGICYVGLLSQAPQKSVLNKIGCCYSLVIVCWTNRCSIEKTINTMSHIAQFRIIESDQRRSDLLSHTICLCICLCACARPVSQFTLQIQIKKTKIYGAYAKDIQRHHNIIYIKWKQHTHRPARQGKTKACIFYLYAFFRCICGLLLIAVTTSLNLNHFWPKLQNVLRRIKSNRNFSCLSFLFCFCIVLLLIKCTISNIGFFSIVQLSTNGILQKIA